MNKTKLLFFVFFIFYSIDSTAQVLVGPVVGGHLGWSTFGEKDNKDIYKLKPYMGFHAGGSISFRVRKKFFLQTSVLYSRKGKTVEGKKDQMLLNDTKFNYLEMPILYTAEFKGKVGEKGAKEFKWYLGVGPIISYWLGGKGVLNASDLSENGINPPSYSLPYKITFGKARADVKQGEMNVEEANRLQLGLTASAGLIFEPVGLNKFMFVVRYEYGHSYLSRNGKGYFGGLDGVLYYEDELKVRMQSLNMSLFYYIDLRTDQRKKGKSTIKTKKGKLK